MYSKALFLLISTILASPPSEEYCKQARLAYTIAGAQCAIAAAISGPFATACGVGIGVYTISIEIACNVAGHFTSIELPPIATKLPNGTIIDVPGNQMLNLVEQSTHFLEKRTEKLCGAGLECLTLDHVFYTNLGLAANSTEQCTVVGQQICVPGHRGFITCASDNKWTVQQACGAGTQCQEHPNSKERILCA